MAKKPGNIVKKVKEEERETATDGKVIIKMGAFRNMITHVLRFGSEALDSPVEVMGICMGKNVKGDIIIENSIPITHGSRIEVGFSPEDYAAFAQIDEQYADKGLFAVGWYHSHPGWGLFFSDADIKNHLFYQKSQTPNAFGIVFDHTLMGKDGNLGFDVYRLKDYSKGPASDYLKVPYEIEVPKTLDYYKWVAKFIEDSQKKAPILIKEINEIIEPIEGDLQAIPKPDEEIGEEGEVDKYPKITPIISGFSQGTSEFMEQFMNIFKSQLGLWSNDVSQGTIKGSIFMRNTLNEMKEAINFGMSKVQNWFENNLEEIVDEFKTDISEYLDIRINAQKELTSHVTDTKTQINEELNTLVLENIQSIVKKIDESAKSSLDKLNSATESSSKYEEVISKNSEAISSIASESNKLSEEIIKTLEGVITPIESNITKEIHKLSSDVDSIKNTYSELSEKFQKLQKLIMELRNI